MVFFTCNSCGSCIKKPAVEKHIYQCRNFGSLSCMDCNKDFYGDEYKAHTKCVTELEKYSGEGWKAPAGHNKGEKKQGAWMDTVLATVEKAGKNAPPAVKSLLHALTRHDNVPRKKAKFLNFVKNIARNHFDGGTIESVWTLLEQQWKTEREAQAQNGNTNSKNPPQVTQVLTTEENEEQPAKKSKKHKKKRHASEEDTAQEEANQVQIGGLVDEQDEVQEPPKNKKKKKDKHADEYNEIEEPPKKKQKKDKHGDDDEPDEIEGPPKQKKKKKKDKN